MALELRQQLKLAQQLVMTPQLQQAIKLLQLSRVELAETVQQELLENPFLEESLEETANPDKTSAKEQRKDEQEAYDKELSTNADWEDYLGDFSSTTKQVSMRETEALEEMSSFEARLAPAPTLDGHLYWQLMLSPFSEEQIRVGEIIIGSISSNGYLHVSTEELAQIAQSDTETVEQLIEHIQQFDPIGVAARTPQECLLVQVKALNYDRDPILVDIITNHLEDLEKRRYKPLARKYKISLEDLREYLDVIQSLDPMPGARFGGGEAQYVSPDVYIYEYEKEFVIVLNEDGLPQLQLSELTEQLPKTTNAEEKDYYQDKMRSASWLIKSLYQRQRTLYKVVESIVKYQREFFLNGVTSLKPLILKDIADDIGMHESTVSRITTSKYISTPHGIFELKFFFNSAIGLDDGSQVGSESVKALIKKLISEENTKKPLSDEKIGEILKEKLQVNIARRTVAKYRTAMNIPSSSKRKVVF
ncbi:RNA polymerase factor sigma-54 [Halodesulfovibrio sp. MK-HDV]|jgi:RNA polymerase sigma-54 factor|uniref:RNA polymerase factor sigma-54 n=1 Tax=unclassified Halodesulfovibrio TaxID=2644657 RepID=UPI001370C506|nr:RNA polymerase factor sigma-54 [Halodesulfovibrio sp. MK-HDV]KAF1077811.1 RNA polymerase sigma-54 factor [Halodesulfovibrio sp. MK-HDV]